MDRAPFIPLGRIVKAHGLKGEVSVSPLTGPPFFLPEGLDVWLVPPPAQIRRTRILGVRQGPKGPLVTLEGVTEIGLARAIVGSEILARAEDVPDEIAEEPFEVVGMRVSDAERGDLGTVDEVIETGANDVWVVHGPFGEVLIPVIDEVVLEFDEAGGTIAVRLLPGLIDEG